MLTAPIAIGWMYFGMIMALALIVPFGLVFFNLIATLAGGGSRMAEQYGVPLLGELPLDAHIREEADGGRPTVVAAPDTPRAKAYFETARRTAAVLSRRARDRSALFPKIVVEES